MEEPLARARLTTKPASEASGPAAITAAHGPGCVRLRNRSLGAGERPQHGVEAAAGDRDRPALLGDAIPDRVGREAHRGQRVAALVQQGRERAGDQPEQLVAQRRGRGREMDEPAEHRDGIGTLQRWP